MATVHRRSPLLVWIITGFLVLVFSGVTIWRNPAWVSDSQLLETDMRAMPQNARIPLAYADMKVRAAMAVRDTTTRNAALRKIAPYYERGLRLHPRYFMGWQGSGMVHFTLGDYAAAIRDYQIAAALYPGDPLTQQNLAASYRLSGEQFMAQNQPAQALPLLEKAWQLSPDSSILPIISKAKRQ